MKYAFLFLIVILILISCARESDCSIGGLNIGITILNALLILFYSDIRYVKIQSK